MALNRIFWYNLKIAVPSADRQNLWDTQRTKRKCKKTVLAWWSRPFLGQWSHFKKYYTFFKTFLAGWSRNITPFSKLSQHGGPNLSQDRGPTSKNTTSLSKLSQHGGPDLSKDRGPTSKKYYTFFLYPRRVVPRFLMKMLVPEYYPILTQWSHFKTFPRRVVPHDF